MYVEHFLILLFIINIVYCLYATFLSKNNYVYFSYLFFFIVLVPSCFVIGCTAPIKRMELEVLQLEGKNYIFHAGILKEINTTKKKITVDAIEGTRLGLIYSGQKFYEVE